MIRAAGIVFVLVLTLASTTARAGAELTESQPAPTVSPAVVEEAQASFRAGVELYGAGDFQSALEEFERAYRLAPTYKILFNLAQVAYQRRDRVLALRYFTRYLEEGGSAVEPARRAEVEREISRLRLRVGELEIVGGEAGDEVFVDDVRVGVMPMANPVSATVGRRRVEVVASSGRHRVRVVDVTAGGRLRVSFVGPADRSVPALAVPPAPPNPPARPPPPALLSAPAEPAATPAHAAGRSSWGPGVAITWGATALALGGAVYAGRRALQLSGQLERELDGYPISREQLDGLSDERRRWALATDGALLVAAIMGAVALYVTTGRPGPSDARAPTPIAP